MSVQMAVVQERCPACSAPLDIIQQSEQRIKCVYCGSVLRVERHGDTTSVELAERMLGTIEQSGAQTQAEFRRLRLTQELATAEMHLANVQSEIRAIQRGTINAVSRKQLEELHAKSLELQQQIASLKAQLYPDAQPTPNTSPRVADWRFSPQRIGWLLFSLNGRANRAEFWVGALIFFGVYLALVIVLAILRAIPDGDGLIANIGTALFSFVALAQTILLIWIGVAVGVKRFHDRDKAGWWVLLGFIPVVGAIWFLVELGLLPGTLGLNRYG